MATTQDDHLRVFWTVALCAAFPFPATLALLWSGFKKLLAFHDQAFKIIMGAAGIYAGFYFFTNVRELLPLSIVPIWQIVNGGHKFDLWKYLQATWSGAARLSVPLWWLLYAVACMLNPELKAPKERQRDAEPKTTAHSLAQGDDVTKGVYLGGYSSNRRFYLSSDELIKHTALVGTTGSGKTTTLYNFVRYAMLKKQATIIIDGKGDIDLASRIQRMAEVHKRPFYLFSTTDPASFGYNPLENANPTELTDKIMSLTEWSEEHYKLSSQRYLQLLFQILQNKNIPCDLVSVVKYSDRSRLDDLLRIEQCVTSKEFQGLTVNSDDIDLANLGDNDWKEDIVSSNLLQDERADIEEIIESIKSIDRRAVEGLFSRLGVLAEGDLGVLLKRRPAGLLELSRALDEKAVILFSLDSLTYPEQARLLGRLVVSDIKSQISYHARHRPGQRVSLIFDEFNVFVSPGVVDLVNKSRAAGFEALLSFQSLADIDRLDKGKEIRRQIVQNCNTLIVQRQNDPADAEEIANILGTVSRYKLTHQVSVEGETGMGSARQVKQYRYHPDAIKNLRVGEAIIKYHTPRERRVEKIMVRALR